MSFKDIEKELQQVREELSQIECELQDLLERQHNLLQRKQKLQQAVEDKNDAATSSLNNVDWSTAGQTILPIFTCPFIMFKSKMYVW